MDWLDSITCFDDFLGLFRISYHNYLPIAKHGSFPPGNSQLRHSVRARVATCLQCLLK